MADTVDVEIPAGRRHIIERPRLTRLLDATSARVIMLVAPAGYGKTTLARQWLANRPHAWYQAKPASADVAGLALSLAESLAQVAPSVTDGLRERLLATQDASQEINALAQIQADVLLRWPQGTWLAIDDYQFIVTSATADAYIEALLNASPTNLLLTSRVRPTWATSRHLLYGRFYELGRASLAMSDREAQSVLAREGRRRMTGLLPLADGWPAVIGLAALTAGEQPGEALPEALYEFLADELYQEASPPLQRALCTLALGPAITNQLLDFLFGPGEGSELLSEAKRLGFLTNTAPQELDLHPLLRTFLLRKLSESDPAETGAAARRLAAFLLEHKRWDDAFDLCRRYPLPKVLIALVEKANDEMLRTGRLSTVTDWLAACADLGLETPILDIVQAEVALRQGNLAHAEILGVRIGQRENVPRNTRSRAWSVAGQAAYLGNREQAALVHYERALKLAQDRDSRRRASWGKLRCFQAHEGPHDLQQALARFLEEEPHDADELLQSLTAQLMVAARTRGLPDALESALAVHSMLDDVRDPLVRTAYLYVLTRSLSLSARYSEALKFAEEGIGEAERTRLMFVLPYAYTAKAVAELGLRHFREADSVTAEAERLCEEIGDIHNLVEARTLRCKRAIAMGDFNRALEITTDTRWNRRLTREMLGEYTANRALAFACSGEIAQAQAVANEAAGLTTLPEVSAVLACVRAVIAIQETPGVGKPSIRPETLANVFDFSLFDPLVVAYRGCPEVLAVVASCAGRRDVLAEVVRQAHDTQLAKSVGFVVATSRTDADLSPREAEVLELLSLGYTNREIAGALYIAEATAKVHVQRILQKLGVRSRTEAAVVALKERQS